MIQFIRERQNEHSLQYALKETDLKFLKIELSIAKQHAKSSDHHHLWAVKCMVDK